MAHPLVNRLINIINYSGIIQGLVWIVAASLALCAHTGTWELKIVPEERATHNELIRAAFKDLYFNKKNTFMVVDYNAMFAILIAYLAISISWFLFSAIAAFLAAVDLLKLVKNALVVHCMHLGLLVALDITFMAMLCVDYNDIEKKAGKPIKQTTTYKLLANGIMITVAGRGFILLVFNVGCFFYSLLLTMWNPKQEETEASFDNLPIDAYNPGQRRSLVEAFNQDPVANRYIKSYPFAHQNNAFEDAHAMEPHSYRPDLRARPVDPPRVPQGKKTNYAVPTPQGIKPPPPPPPPKPQGKKGPPIPFPDYTPPPSPKILRSVIKPQSSYY